MKNKVSKIETIVAIVVGAIFATLLVWIYIDPVNAIFNILLYGVPICLLLRLIVPKNPNKRSNSSSKRGNNSSGSGWLILH